MHAGDRAHEPWIMNRPPRRSLLALLCAVACAAAAQESAIDAAPVHPRYTVELIVFAYDERARSGDELFVPDVPMAGAYPSAGEAGGEATGEVPVFSDRPGEQGGNAVTGIPGEAATPVIGEDNEISGVDQDLADIPLRARIELTRLPPEAYGMNEIYEKLEELDAYHPIMRAAWIQTTPPEESAPAIRLRALGDPPPGLDGTVTLYQGRFVHLGLDLTLDARAAETLARGAYDPERTATDRAIAQAGFTGSATDADPARGGTPAAYGDPAYGDAPVEPVRYRISEVRIMREGTIRYYDHPRFGVIAKLTRVEDGGPAEATGTRTPSP